MLDDALVCIVDARNDDPDDRKILELHAKICYAKKDFGAAEPLLRECLQIDPANGAIATRLIDVLMLKQAYEEAIWLSLDYLERDWKNQNVQAQLADAYVANGHPEMAVAFLEPLTVKFPQSGRNWYHLAIAYSSMERYEEARIAAHHCLEMNTGSKKALLMLAELYVLHRPELAGAEDTLTTLCRPEFNELLCKVLIRENRLDYLQMFCDPRRAASYATPTLYALCTLALEGELFTYARELIEVFFARESFAGKTFAKYGANCLDRYAHNKALICFTVCLDHDRDNSYCVRSIGECYLRDGETARALSVVNDYLSRHPQNPYVTFLRAKIFCQQGSYDESLDQIRQCLAGNPYDARSNAFAGYIYYHLDLPDLAEKYSLISLDNQPIGNFYALNNLAMVAYRHKDLRRAEKCLVRAVAECPGKATARVNLARIQLELGKLDEAYRTVSRDLTRQIFCNLVFDILTSAIEKNRMDLAKTIVDSLPHEKISESDYTRLFRIVSGEFSREAAYAHISKHFWDDKIKDDHTVFLVEPIHVYNILKDLGQFSYVSYPAGIRKYRIPFQRVGYKGGRNGNMHVLNYLTVITVLNEEYIITAYPSD